MPVAHYVRGSHGCLSVDDTGIVLDYDPDPHNSPDPHYASIMRFDLQEYKRHYGCDTLPRDFDILDLGYWHQSGTAWPRYCEPCHAFRENTKADLQYMDGNGL